MQGAGGDDGSQQAADSLDRLPGQHGLKCEVHPAEAEDGGMCGPISLPLSHLGVSGCLQGWVEDQLGFQPLPLLDGDSVAIAETQPTKPQGVDEESRKT